MALGRRKREAQALWVATKRYLIQVAGRNLGVIMRKLFGLGTLLSDGNELRRLQRGQRRRRQQRYAVWFQGNLNVNGVLTKSSGAFKIHHPLTGG